MDRTIAQLNIAHFREKLVTERDETKPPNAAAPAGRGRFQIGRAE